LLVYYSRDQNCVGENNCSTHCPKLPENLGNKNPDIGYVVVFYSGIAFSGHDYRQNRWILQLVEQFITENSTIGVEEAAAPLATYINQSLPQDVTEFISITKFIFKNNSLLSLNSPFITFLAYLPALFIDRFRHHFCHSLFREFSK
jgi:hypothetical protein